MAEYLGQITGNCDTVKARTGSVACNVREGKTKALLLSFLSSRYPTSATEFTAGLQGWINGSDSNLIMPIKNVVGVEPSGGEVETADIGDYGMSKPTGQSQYIETYTIDEGECMYKELMKLNRERVRVQRIDDKGIKFSTDIASGDDVETTGFLADVYVTRTRGTGSAAYSLTLTLYYTDSYEDELANMRAQTIGLSAIPDGLRGITLQAMGGGMAKVVEACSGTNITAQYGSAWQVESSDDGVAVTIAYNATTKLLNLNSFNTLPAEGAYFKLSDVTTLYEAGITGYEGIDEYVLITP